MRKRVLILVHPQLRPDKRGTPYTSEKDVWRTLKRLGFETEILGVQDNIHDIDIAVNRFKPDVVFNLLEEIRDEGIFDFHPISRLELLGIPYTGCNPRGLIVSRNKYWVYQIAHGMGVLTPSSKIIRGSKIPRGIKFPAFVKFNREHASLGINNSNCVRTDKQLRAVVKRMQSRMAGEILIQEFIAGDDVSVAVMGNRMARAFPPWTLRMKDKNAFATEQVKFSKELRRRLGIRAIRYTGSGADLTVSIAKRLFITLDLNGYARFDFRVREGVPYLVDVNANPNLGKSEDLARSAGRNGLSYESLIQKLVYLAERYVPQK